MKSESEGKTKMEALALCVEENRVCLFLSFLSGFLGRFTEAHRYPLTKIPLYFLYSRILHRPSKAFEG